MPYSFDRVSKSVLIRELSEEGWPEILHKGDKCWSPLRPRPDFKDEDYCRAVYLGQGCWEDLQSIDETEALKILHEWGYEENPPSEA